jgi:hypothetical protein
VQESQTVILLPHFLFPEMAFLGDCTAYQSAWGDGIVLLDFLFGSLPQAGRIMRTNKNRFWMMLVSSIYRVLLLRTYGPTGDSWEVIQYPPAELHG